MLSRSIREREATATETCAVAQILSNSLSRSSAVRRLESSMPRGNAVGIENHGGRHHGSGERPAAGISETLSFVNAFSDYCVRQYDTDILNPKVAATFHERLVAYRKLDVRNEHSLLKHLGVSKVEKERANLARAVQSPRSPKVSDLSPPRFPRRRRSTSSYRRGIDETVEVND